MYAAHGSPEQTCYEYAISRELSMPHAARNHGMAGELVAFLRTGRFSADIKYRNDLLNEKSLDDSGDFKPRHFSSGAHCPKEECMSHLCRRQMDGRRAH